MATFAEEQAARFAADKKAREAESFMSKLKRTFITDKTGAAAATPVPAPAAPASSTREILKNRGRQIDEVVNKATMKRGGSVKAMKNPSPAPAKKKASRW